jgi:phosphogluconate dehydratase
VPLLARVYPNGASDVNMYQAAGGLGFVVRELLGAGLVHRDIMTMFGDDLGAYAQEPWLDGDTLAWREPGPSGDETILRGAADPFQPDGGMRLLEGNLGRAVFKTSAIEPERWTVEAPCLVFETQAAVAQAFAAGALDRDVVVVVRFQGPRANGMPELHKLTPVLGVVQDRGYKVALVTDGRMSGASGKVPAAIHVSPEALEKDGVWGPLALLRDGDVVRVSGDDGTLSTTADLSGREPARMREADQGTGRELFGMFRAFADEAERGASAMLAESGL